MISKTIDIKYLLERIGEVSRYIDSGNDLMEEIEKQIEDVGNMFEAARIEIDDLLAWIKNPDQWWVGDEEKEGRFPKKQRLSTNAVGWLESEINEWLQSRAIVNNDDK